MHSSRVPKIGLEIHIQLSTPQKAFCGCRVDQHAEPNTSVCPVCLGYPGALPVLNPDVVDAAVLAGSALGMRINRRSSFDRKSYFYPDLPKGYQITQYQEPICKGGSVAYFMSGEQMTAILYRMHIEEDAGKLHHEGESTLVDFNRCGVPLLEFVSAPDFTGGEQASSFLKELRRIVRYLGISNGNMEDGSFRCDVNISLDGGEKVEVKNLNSFAFVAAAVDAEIARQDGIYSEGGTVVQETRSWNERERRTDPMRGKEGSAEYLYMPEPDLPPLSLTDEMIDRIASEAHELPSQKYCRYVEELNLSPAAAEYLTGDVGIAAYFESCLDLLGEAPEVTRTLIANWIMGDLAYHCNARSEPLSFCLVTPQKLVELILMLHEERISEPSAKEVLGEVMSTGTPPSEIVESRGLQQITDKSELQALVRRVVEEHPDQVAEYLAGKERLFGFFVGETMKLSGGRANPQAVTSLLADELAHGRK